MNRFTFLLPLLLLIATCASFPLRASEPDQAEIRHFHRVGAQPSGSTLNPTIKLAPLNYPETELQFGITGKTTLIISNDQTGKITKVVIEQSSGNSNLDDAAIEMAWASQVTPAYRDGKPIPSDLRIPVVFSIDSGP